MLLIRTVLFSCLLIHLAGESTISLVDCHGEEEGELFLFVENDDKQLQHHPQTSVSAADSQDTSADPAQSVETALKDRVPGQQASCQLKERSEKLSQPQNTNDKYTYSSTSDTFFFDAYYSHKQYFELQEQIFTISSKNVKGRLAENISFWKEIGANSEILNVLKEGYKIPFLESPSESFSKNNASALKNIEFVVEAVSKLVQNKCVVETDFKPFVVSPLSVSVNKLGKKRLILDLRNLNKLLWKQKNWFEDWKVAIDYFEKDSFCFKYDLSKGYHHINIFPGHQTFLGFSVKEKYYSFTVLPFGLSTAPFIFTKVLREMVKYWRNHSIKIVMFLDDGWGTNKNQFLCSVDAEFVRNSLEKAGFVINYEKSVWPPIQRLEWLGLFWDSVLFSMSIPERHINDLKRNLEDLFLAFPIVTARKLAQCVGKIISMMPVIGNIARLMTRRCYIIIESRESWDSVLRLSSSDFCITELNFWRKSIDSLNFRKLGGYRCPDTIVVSDASSTGCSSYIVKSQSSVFHRSWNEEEKVKHSTFRELRAVYLALRAYGSKFENRSVK